jgi:signal peptidase II
VKNLWASLVVIFVVVLVDQVTKALIQQHFYYGEVRTVIEGFFNVIYVKNTGAAWSMASDAHPLIRLILLKIGPVILTVVLFWFVLRTLKSAWYLRYAYTLITAGAIGNLIDRISMDYVVDFLDFYYKSSHFATFNVADSAITVGAVLLGYEYLIIEPRKKKYALKH